MNNSNKIKFNDAPIDEHSSKILDIIKEQKSECELDEKENFIDNEFKEIMKDGKVSEKHLLKDGLKNGEIIYYKDGRISQRVNYEEGKIDGTVEIYKDGVLNLIMNYQNEVPHGPMYSFSGGKLLQMGQYIKGLKNGTFFSFKDAYLMQEQNYKNDLLYGNHIVYHPKSTQIFELGQYENNDKIGIWKQFNIKGEVIKESH